MADQIQMAADHIAAFHSYMGDISGQLSEVNEYLWTNVALTDAYGDGLLSPLRDYVRDLACRPFGDALSVAATRLGRAKYGLWAAGYQLDMVDDTVSEYYRSTMDYQDTT